MKACDALAERIEPAITRVILFDQPAEPAYLERHDNVIPLFDNVPILDDDEDWDPKPLTMGLFAIALYALVMGPMALLRYIF